MVKKKNEKAYCEKCDKDVFYGTYLVKRIATIRGIKVEYDHTVAICQECGERVYPVSVGKQNDIAKYDSYKKMVGLLTSRDIIELRKKLNLSQVDFAKKLGCGEKTIARYENGAIQEKVIDNFIKQIRDENNSSLNANIIYVTFISPNKSQSSTFSVFDRSSTSYDRETCDKKAYCYC